MYMVHGVHQHHYQKPSNFSPQMLTFVIVRIRMELKLLKWLHSLLHYAARGLHMKLVYRVTWPLVVFQHKLLYHLICISDLYFPNSIVCFAVLLDAYLLKEESDLVLFSIFLMLINLMRRPKPTVIVSTIKYCVYQHVYLLPLCHRATLLSKYY